MRLGTFFPVAVLLAAMPVKLAWAQTAMAAAFLDGTPLGAGTVEGVASSTDGSVYEGVTAALAETGTNAATQTQTTGADGAFRFEHLSAGSFRLTLSSPGFVTRVVTGSLHEGETFDAGDVMLALATATSDVQITAWQADIGEADVKIEETQRVLGVVPNFFVTYDHDAPPMTPRQKFEIAWRTDIDPVTWAATGLIAGMQQANNTFAAYGQGAQGYAKRFGAGYADGAINTMIGSAILPAVLKQDPRYFYKGTGTVTSRAWYAIANSVICKGDNGRWQPNYSAIGGGLAAGGISNLYYPAGSRGARVTFDGVLIGTGEGAIQNLFQEFVVKKLTPGARKSAKLGE